MPHHKTGNRKCLFDCPHICAHLLFTFVEGCSAEVSTNSATVRIGSCAIDSNYFNCWKLPICNEQRDGKDCRKGPGEDEQGSQAPPVYFHSKIIALSFRTTLWSNPAPPNQRVQVQELCHPKVHLRVCTVSLFFFSRVATVQCIVRPKTRLFVQSVRFVALPSQKWRIALAPNN